MNDKLKLYGFNNLTKTLSFNIYDICYAKSAREQQDYIKYIDEHFTDNISLEVIANRFSMSASYLGKLVKSSTNLSYNAYINKLRINYACNLILNTSMSFPDIAKESGYSTTTYFYSSFKKILGMTPGEYKDSHKNDNPYKYDF